METRFESRWSFRFLCASPLLSALIGGSGALGVPSASRYAAAGVLIAAMLVAMWRLGARAIRIDVPERRRLAVSGGLLVAVLALLAIFTVMGPPQRASLTVNQIRYPLLLVASIAMATGLIVLERSLGEAGERFLSTLGFAAMQLAGPMYVCFAAMQLVEYRSLTGDGSGPPPPEIRLLDSLSVTLLAFGAALTYLATAAFASSMGRVRWLGPTASRVYTSLSLLAVSCVGLRLIEAFRSAENPLLGFKHWTSIPGLILMIPALPWIMPCLLGIVLLKRAGQESAGS